MDFGATPRITNKSRPNGGVIRLISMTTRNRTPSHYISMPWAPAIGRKNGSVNNIMLT